MKINNMPDGYKYEQDLFDGYVLCASYDAFDYKNDLYFKNEKTDYVVYIYPEDYNPVYTTTMPSENTTTTTTSTKTSIKTTESTSGTTTTTTTETVPVEKGNVNVDYTIDISDASMVLLMYANSTTGMDMSEYTEKQLSAADVDEDEMITISDAAFILTFYAQNAAGMNSLWEDILKK